MKVLRVSWCRYRVPLRVPLRTAFGEVRLREGLLLRLEVEGGLGGVGEAAPHLWGGPGVEGLASAAAQLAPRLLGLEVEASLGALARLPPPLAFALETAALDVLAQARGLPLAQLLSPTPAAWVAVNALITGSRPEECAREAREAVSLGYRCLKVKVGALPLSVDVRRLAAVREAAGPEALLRADANGAWQDVGEAARAIAALAPLGLQYVEQPLPPGRWEDMALLRRVTGVPLAADEDVTDPGTARILLERGAADVLVLKPSLLGGLGRSLDCAALCHQAGAGAVVTTALETAVGTAACLHLAAALPGPRLAAGLATLSLLAHGLAAGPLVLRDGSLALPSAPGLGQHLDHDALRRYASPWIVVG